jgi:hypothetical protein
LPSPNGERRASAGLLPVQINDEYYWGGGLVSKAEEILDRRVGKNELDTIKTIADALDKYSSVDREGRGVRAYTQRFLSSRGQRDRVYWPTEESEPKSPLGPLVGEAVRVGYDARIRPAGQERTPYHGYYFRMLLSQGARATGGAFPYVINGRMMAASPSSHIPPGTAFQVLRPS